jgi:hypothetical protein
VSERIFERTNQRCEVRIVTAVAALCLALVGCGGDGEGGGATAPATVAVGGVLGAFPHTVPVTEPTTRPSRPSRPTTTSTSTSSTTSTTVPARTVFAVALADLVDGALPGEPIVTDRLVDDSGRLSLDVPTEWAERDTSIGPLGNGEGAPHVAASPDLRRFLDGYDAAGLTVVVLPDTRDLAAALDSYRFDDDCAPSGDGDYGGESMTGEYRVWRDCGGTGTDIVTVVVDAGREAVLLLAQVRGPADLAALDTALATLSVSGH